MFVYLRVLLFKKFDLLIIYYSSVKKIEWPSTINLNRVALKIIRMKLIIILIQFFLMFLANVCFS